MLYDEIYKKSFENPFEALLSFCNLYLDVTKIKTVLKLANCLSIALKFSGGIQPQTLEEILEERYLFEKYTEQQNGDKKPAWAAPGKKPGEIVTFSNSVDFLKYSCKNLSDFDFVSVIIVLFTLLTKGYKDDEALPEEKAVWVAETLLIMAYQRGSSGMISRLI